MKTTATTTTTTRMAMAVDMQACVGCSACTIACKTENDVPLGMTRRWVSKVTQGRFPDLQMQVWSDCCQHCDIAPCVSSCPTGASHIDEATGTTQVHKDRCTGCKACIASCPYDARFVRPEGYVDKCTLCLHRVQGGDTACTEVCPTSAILVGDLNDADSSISKAIRSRPFRQQKVAAGTKPRFFLLG